MCTHKVRIRDHLFCQQCIVLVDWRAILKHTHQSFVNPCSIMHNQKQFLVFTKRAKLQDITVMKYSSTFSNLVGALYRETNLSEIDSSIINFLPSFLPSLGIVVFTIIQGYIQISPRMKPLVCMQGMNLLLWSVNSSTSNHAFLNHSDRTEIWRKHFCCLVINNDSVPTLTPSECTLLLNLPGCTKKIVPIGVSSDMYARKRFWKEGFVPS